MTEQKNHWKTATLVLGGILIGVVIGGPLAGGLNLNFDFLKPDKQLKEIKKFVTENEEKFKLLTEKTTKTEEGFYSLGNKNAPVKMVEFSDYQCPFCQNFFTQTFGEIFDRYIKTEKVFFTYKDLPLSFHPNAEPAAHAAYCGGEQGKYFQMHELMFEFGSFWTEEKDAFPIFKKFAKALKLKKSEFKKCFEEKKYTEVIQKGIEAAEKTDITGTPGFLINEERISGAQPFFTFQQTIERQLQNQNQPAQLAQPAETK